MRLQHRSTRRDSGMAWQTQGVESKKHILLVDDDFVVRSVASRALSALGYQITDFGDGVTALQSLDQCHFDAVLLDARMPGLDGFKTCQAMRQLMSDDPIPIVMATGMDDDDSIEEAYQAGATDFVSKPVNWRILKKRLDVLMNAREVSRSIKDRAERERCLLRASSDAMISLDHEGVIQAIHQNSALPRGLSSIIGAGKCLFDCLPSDSVKGALVSWQQATRKEDAREFLVSSHAEENPFVVEGRFIEGFKGDYLCLLRNFTDSYLAEKTIYKLAYTDASTGVANATMVTEKLTRMLDYGRDQHRETALLRCLITNFGSFEVTSGRSGMHYLAQEVVQRIKRLSQTYLDHSGIPTRPTEEDIVIGRMAENEFVVLISGIADSKALVKYSEMLYNALVEPFTINGYCIALEISIGVADSQQAGSTAELLLGSAAYALNDSKQQPVRLYSIDLKESMHKRIELERLLRRDVYQGALDMHYQPKFCMTTMQLVGIEALIRWHPDELGVVSPAEFIPVAEQCGLMIALSELVVQKVFEQIVCWGKSGKKRVPISINLSGSHLKTKGIVKYLQEAIDIHNLDPTLVEVEVTESMMIDPESRAIANLHELRAMGIRVAVDDFGTGYSSLSYLQTLPIDCLKIDRSFVKTINSDQTSLAIARAIVTIGHDIGLHVVAEGVENQQQLTCLQQLGCDSVQGFFTGRPVSADAFIDFFDGAKINSPRSQSA